MRSQYCQGAILLVAGLAMALTARAQMPMLDAFEIGEVRRVTVAEEGSNLVARVTLAFQNKMEMDLKVRSGDFRISAVGKNEGDRILIGKTHVADLLLAAGTGGMASTTEHELSLVLGSDRVDIMQRLSALVLAVASAKDELKTRLEGECEIGIKKGNAWQYVKGLSFELDLDPETDWDVLWDKTAKGGITIDFGEDKPRP